MHINKLYWLQCKPKSVFVCEMLSNYCREFQCKQTEQSNLNEFVLTQPKIKQKDDRPRTNQTNTTVQWRSEFIDTCHSFLVPRLTIALPLLSKLSCPLTTAAVPDGWLSVVCWLQQGHGTHNYSICHWISCSFSFALSSSSSPPSCIFPVAQLWNPQDSS